jgi:hypothetical protein
MILYVGAVVLLFYAIDLWRITQLKNTIFWFLGTAFILLINSNNAIDDKDYFKKLLRKNLEFLVILQFIINLYTFSLAIELIILPSITFIIMIAAVAAMQQRNEVVKQAADSVLAIFGFFLIAYAIVSILDNFQGFATSENILSFILPLLLTFVYLPFLYFFALFVAYQDVFVQIDMFLRRDQDLANFVRQKILISCKVNLRKISRFTKEYTKKLTTLKNTDDVMALIQDFEKGDDDSSSL